MAAAGDVNADGITDIIIGNPLATAPTGEYGAGQALVYSGANGSLLYSWYGNQNDGQFGRAVAAAGDANGDGHADLLIAAPYTGNGPHINSGSVFLHSGADGSLLRRWDGPGSAIRLGEALANVGDIDGDGIDEVAMRYRIPQGVDLGMVGIYRTTTGVKIRDLGDPAGVTSFGLAISSAGDVNQDGIPDVIVGAPDETKWINNKTGSATVYSGADGTEIHRWTGNKAFTYYGQAVASTPDQNGDGVGDLLVGAPGYSTSFKTSAGSVSLLSGADGSLIHQWVGEDAYHRIGNSVDYLGDVNGDGLGEVIAGAVKQTGNGYINAGAVYVFHGLDRSIMMKWYGDNSGVSLGAAVCGVGDLDSDGLNDIAYSGDRREFGNGYPLMVVQSFHPYIKPSTPTVSAQQGTTVVLEYSFPSEAAGYHYQTLLSASGIGVMYFGVAIPLNFDNYVWDSFFNRYPFVAQNLTGTLDGNATATGSFTTESGASSALVGRNFYLAAIAYRPQNLPEYSSAPITMLIEP